MKRFSLAYSPCPNDTFLFYHLVHQNLSPDFSIQEELHDVEHLNQAAEKKTYDITKLSFFAFFHFSDRYVLLNSGSALGRGCGPLLVKKRGRNIPELKNCRIIVPGLLTTANLLLQIYAGIRLDPVPVRYDLIAGTLNQEEADLGLIIHEERFTYQDKGLEIVQDLGDFWEKVSGLPIPLGAIAVRRDMDSSIQREIDRTLRKSLKLSWADPDKAQKYILENSQEKDLKVVQSHITLYVNSFTEDLGAEGKKAVLELQKRAFQAGILPVERTDLFLEDF